MDGKDGGKTSLVRNVNIYKYERRDVKVKCPFHSGKNYVMEFFFTAQEGHRKCRGTREARIESLSLNSRL